VESRVNRGPYRGLRHVWKVTLLAGLVILTLILIDSRDSESFAGSTSNCSCLVLLGIVLVIGSFFLYSISKFVPTPQTRQADRELLEGPERDVTQVGGQGQVSPRTKQRRIRSAGSRNHSSFHKLLSCHAAQALLEGAEPPPARSQ
jgi:hypothetical protein